MKKLLITGAKGQVGQELTQQANFHSFKPIPLSRADLDISDYDQVDQTVNDIKPDIIINAAAFTNVDLAETKQEQALACNKEGPDNLAVTAAKLNIPLFHISTDFIFDGEKNTPYIEDDDPNPLSFYGESKLLGEEAVWTVWDKHIILRVSWVFGQYGHNFFSGVADWAKNKKELQIVSDQVGGPTPANAVAETLLVLAAKSIEQNNSFYWGTYHYSGLPAVSRFEYTQFIVSELKKMGVENLANLVPVPASHYPMPAQRPAYSALDSGLLERNFGIKAPDWQEGARELIKIK
ncbi:MAG: dTDP-4-dehydrorhamnose reductase [Magnetococcales bacterium]|nr:dTDP-4-dehydrorhamnose reductase [Magnetococcales bacterium]